jgi:predicted MPP superfamily phosphohydrolase
MALPAAAGGRCRVVFVSDLHVGPTTAPSLHDRLIAVVREARPDVLLLGGDYVYLEATPDVVARLAGLVRALEAPTKLAVMGNHDLWTEDSLVAGALEQGGARVLVNDVARLPAPWGDCHSPDGLLSAADHHFDLYVCGHTHGGQVAAPWGPIVLPKGEMCRRFPSGFARFNSGEVFVSRGVGSVDLPGRLFAEPDLLVLDLERAAC